MDIKILKIFIKAFGKSKYLNQNFKIICYGGEKFSRDEKDFLKTVELVKVKFFIIMMMIMNFHIYMLMFVH